ncbi:MAG: AIR synthase-related protein, partial [Acidimicrobiia bacterium]
AATRYRRLHRAMQDGLVQSCHDPSEGGLAVALAEMCIAGRLGVEVTDLPHTDLATALFAESQSRLVVEVDTGDLETFTATMQEPVLVLGRVTDDPHLVLPGVEPLRVDELVDAFGGEDES